MQLIPQSIPVSIDLSRLFCFLRSSLVLFSVVFSDLDRNVCKLRGLSIREFPKILKMTSILAVQSRGIVGKGVSIRGP